jgi:formylglycine-generating enzyme required for sulfatase activity
MVKRIVVLIALTLMVIVASTTIRAPDPGRPARWIDPVTGIDFILVQPSVFQMGTPDSEPLREAQEIRHEVRLTRPYYLAAHELTQSQWTRVMGSNPSFFQSCGELCPVERLNYYDVEQLIRVLNQRSTPGFRLPTEAEWEHACRAGGVEPFGHRSTLGSGDANIDGAFPYAASKGQARNQPIAVGRFPANPWGFYDMSGNVWEWVQDWYCLYPDKAVTDPVGECSSQFRVIRGGSWKFDGGSARCGLRYIHRPQDSGYSLGVRLAHDVW